MAFKKIRELKVSGQSGYHYKATPTIMLKGQWLEELGFDIDALIRVECENGRLIITPDHEREQRLAEEKAFMDAEMEKFQAQMVAERKLRYGK
ncbi:MAG: type I toxin-antitoxin system SymE family toxin [Lachnospiraceae bacterium]|nr:type I toxin-antitoxin system SymE family toxin [Lachnospiraceae bacterium]